MPTVLDQVRKLAEDCESLQGFQLSHSLGGGTGSGMGTLLMTKLAEEYPDRIMSSISVIPGFSECVVEPYNTILALHQMIEFAALVFTVENSKLMDMASKKLKLEKPYYADLNKMIASAMSGVTCSIRFPADGGDHKNSDLRKLAVNLVPFPRLHFFVVGYAPIHNSKNSSPISVADLTQEVFDQGSIMTQCDPIHNGRFVSASVMFRGSNISAAQIEDEVYKNIQNKFSNQFIPWIPDNLMTSMCSYSCRSVNEKSSPQKEQLSNMSATLVTSSTAIKDVFKKVHNMFDKLFRRKAFLRGFCSEGMDEMEFTEAGYNVKYLIEEYQAYEDAGIDDDDDSEDTATASADQALKNE